MPAVQAFQKLSSVDEIKVFFGPVCGSPQTAIAPLLARNNQFVLLGNAAPESVYKLSKGRMLSTQHSIESESRFLAEQMNQQAIRSVVLVFQESDFSRTHEAAFRSAFKGQILEVVAFNSEDTSAIKTASLIIKRKRPDAVFSPDATPFFLGLTKELDNIGLSGITIWSVYGTQTDAVLDVVKDSSRKSSTHTPILVRRMLSSIFPEKPCKC